VPLDRQYKVTICDPFRVKEVPSSRADRLIFNQ